MRRNIQALGGYSIVRGTPDRESFRMTRQILSQPGAKLVVFPEGEVYTQNDTLGLSRKVSYEARPDEWLWLYAAKPK